MRIVLVAIVIFALLLAAYLFFGQHSETEETRPANYSLPTTVQKSENVVIIGRGRR